MEEFLRNPGLFHLGEKIFDYLPEESEIQNYLKVVFICSK